MRQALNAFCLLLLAPSLLFVLAGCGRGWAGIEVKGIGLTQDNEAAVIRLSETRPGGLDDALSGSERVFILHEKSGIFISSPLIKDAPKESITFPNHGKIFKKGDSVHVVIGGFSSAPVVLE
ncbi:MAG: hypothetical protein A2V21_312610 [Deltaproteobacteria bacterium GWC2_55_46]|nr:MAG: hypothetical protein A2V21_312610 [Deltaproteobacteria bacterium GWC2_55_46]